MATYLLDDRGDPPCLSAPQTVRLRARGGFGSATQSTDGTLTRRRTSLNSLLKVTHGEYGLGDICHGPEHLTHPNGLSVAVR